jgi:hypothetical protein
MNCFIKNPGSGVNGSSELKAILFALLACFIFIGFLTARHRLAAGNRRQVIVNRSQRLAPPPPPVRPAQVPQVPTEVTPPAPDLNQRFRYVPSNFRAIDFKNRSYGDYTFSDGKTVDLALIDGQFRNYVGSSNWFDFNDVFYTDLTGDSSPEAIVMLTHIQCKSKCDGGKNLIYVYSMNYAGFKEILKYESGSGLEGCSLKSLIVKNRQLALELFGRCPQQSKDSTPLVRRDTYDLTRVEFRFNGEQLLAQKKTHVTVPDCGEVDYGVEVRIRDERSPVEVTTRRPKDSGPCA